MKGFMSMKGSTNKAKGAVSAAINGMVAFDGQQFGG